MIVLDEASSSNTDNAEVIDLSESLIEVAETSPSADSSPSPTEPLFFEDRCPNTQIEAPLYESTLPAICDSETIPDMSRYSSFQQRNLRININNNNNNNIEKHNSCPDDLRSLLTDKYPNAYPPDLRTLLVEKSPVQGAEPELSSAVPRKTVQVSAENTSAPTAGWRTRTITTRSSNAESQKPPNESNNKENTTEPTQPMKRVIITAPESESNPKRKRRDSDVIFVDEKRDDAVVFISESRMAGGSITRRARNYIPIEAPNQSRSKGRMEKRSVRANRKKTKREQRKLNLQIARQEIDSLVNRTVPEKQTRAAKSSSPNQPDELEKRMVIIDGSNVACTHGSPNFFSVKGIELCLQYFETRGFEVKAVVPQMRLRMGKSSDPKTLEKLANEKKVVLTPSKNLPGNRSSSYDDRFILEIAAHSEAAVISNDNYKDLLNQNDSMYLCSSLNGFALDSLDNEGICYERSS